ncbi:MAG: DUF1428 family protein [Nitrospiraceae bacterium]
MRGTVGRPSSGIFRQSYLLRFRRCHNARVIAQGDCHVPLCRWFRLAGSEEERGTLSPHCAESWKVWREHGALEYPECVGDDIKAKGTVFVPRTVKLRRGETVFFSWIVYKSRAHRDCSPQRIPMPARKRRAAQIPDR